MVVLDGTKIVRLRTAQGLSSQRALAERTRRVDPNGAGVGVRLVWNAENGKPVSVRTQRLIAEALDVAPEELLKVRSRERAAALARSTVGLVCAGALAGVLIGGGAMWFASRSPADDPVTPVRAGSGTAGVKIDSVRFVGGPGDYGIAISGSGFGASPFSGTLYGSAPYLSLFDDSLHFQAGYSGNPVALAYLLWTDNRIVIDDVPAMPGDSITINLWNPVTRVGAAWGGNVPPTGGSTPRIESVAFIGDRVRITGTGFGPPPQPVPFASNMGYVVITDGAYHRWGNGRSVAFIVGQVFSPTKLAFTEWTSSVIEIGGFAGPSPADMKILPGDPVTVELWNPRIAFTNRTAWGGAAH